MNAQEFEKALDVMIDREIAHEQAMKIEHARQKFWCSVFDGAIAALISISAIYLVYRIVTAL